MAKSVAEDHANGMALARLQLVDPHAQCKAAADELRRKMAELDLKIENMTIGLRSTENMLNGKIRVLEKDKLELEVKLDDANKTLSWFRNDKFGSKSERLEPEESTEETTKPADSEAQLQSGPKRPKGQQPGSDGHGRTDRSGIPVSETVPLDIPGGCTCAKCGKEYVILPATDDSSLLELVIFLHQVRYARSRYAPQCNCPGNKIETAAAAPKLYPRTTVGNSLWLWLVVQKFLFGVPTNRSLKDLSLQGAPLAKGTVTGGFEIIHKLIDGLYEQIKQHCRGAEQWNGDETTWRVFDADKTKWWLWVMASQDAVVYILDPSRSAEVPNGFFAGSVGVLITDRLASYKKLSADIRKAWCWVHQRRDFHKIYDGTPKLRSWALDWLLEITELFTRNDKRYKLWQQGRRNTAAWIEAQQAVEQQAAKLKHKWEEQLKLPGLHKQQKTALNSFRRHWDGLMLFVSDVRIPMDNNRAERLLRGAVILRKNSYGSGSAWAGNFAAKVLTLFHTWLANGLDPQALFLDFLTECSMNPGNPPGDLSPFLPWKMSPERKQACALPRNYKRPG